MAGTPRRALKAFVLLAPLLFGATAGADSEAHKNVLRGRFAAAKRKIVFDAGTERAKLGTWCRDAGLVAQATATFLRAVEDSDGTNWWAVKIVDLMRKSDDKFWRAVNPHPGKAYLDTFEKKSRRVDEDREDAFFRLANDAYKNDLFDEAVGLWSDLVRETDQPLVFDAGGQVVVPAGKLPLDVSAKIKAAQISINGKPYLRDAFLELVPEVKEVREATGDRFRVRIQGATQAPDDLLASLEALLPFLEDDLGGRPTRRMSLFLFQDTATYSKWCDAAKMPAFAAASGFADGATNTAVVCAAGAPVAALRGMCLHESSHLFMYGVTPAVMPSWYAEGFAETYGGEGTFTWTDGKLTAGGKMTSAYVAPLKTREAYIPLSDLVAGDALKILSKDRAKGRNFYAESWAFLRWMRTASSPDVQARFRLWEVSCRGAAFGAQAGKPREFDAAPAASEFQRRFGSDLAAMEKAFQAWLAAQ